jgi:hypothetical protein
LSYRADPELGCALILFAVLILLAVAFLLGVVIGALF